MQELREIMERINASAGATDAQNSVIPWWYTGRIFFSLLLLLLLYFAAADSAQTQEIRVLQHETSGGALPLSIQNEVNAAIARAQAWLLHRQAEDGSWGTNNRPLLTALASLALMSDGIQTPAKAKAVAQAVAWSLKAWGENRPQESETLGWSAIMLLLATNHPPADVAQSLSASAGASTTNRLEFTARLALAEAAELVQSNALAKIFVQPDATNLLPELYAALPFLKVAPQHSARLSAKLAREWESEAVADWRNGEARKAWWLARAINRAANGILLESQEQAAQPLPWRQTLARDRIASQLADIHGDGWWRAVTAQKESAQYLDGTIIETAFNILLLNEL